MGMYTGLRGSIKFKPKVDSLMSIWFQEDFDGDISFFWDDVLRDFKENTDVKVFLSKCRRSFIPFGAVCYMPSNWDESGETKFLEIGVMSFTCSLKNYDSEIEAFINILPHIADGWLLEKRYEECEESTFYIK